MDDGSGLGRVEFRDGSAVELSDDVLMRIAYAMTTLALTPVISHVAVEAVIMSSGDNIWPGQTRTG